MDYKKVISTNTAPKAIGAYSQAIVFENLLFTSGQIPIDPISGDIISEKIEDQIRQVFSNLETNFDWEQVYSTFKNMPVTKKYKLKWKRPKLSKVSKILLSHDFSESRVNKLLDRLSKNKQDNLDNWF